jgi:amino acid adenylation domain-containing protein
MAYLLQQLLSESAERQPDKTAIIFKDDKISYADLEKESNKLAYSLLEMGVKKGERIGIHLNRSINAIVGAFGILKTGAAYVPIDPACPLDRFTYIINKCGTRLLLTSREKLTKLEKAFQSCFSLETLVIMNGLDPGDSQFGSPKLLDWLRIREGAPESPIDSKGIDSDMAYILFTSGSTGNPKGVMISHLNSLTFVNSAHDFFSIESGDRFSNICPLHFDMSVFDLFVAFKARASVVIVPETTTTFPSELAKFIEKNRITVWNSVPSALSLLANFKGLDNHDLSSLRLIMFAGEIFPVKYLRRLRRSIPGATFYNIYGQTEANFSTFYLVKETPFDDNAVLPIGKPLPNFEVYALDEAGNRITRTGEKGELYVRGSSVALGYWDDVEKTEESFVLNSLKTYAGERVYKTGDLVTLDGDGNYTFIGRKDHLIKSRGYRIEIGEIETVLSRHPGIQSVAVIPIRDELIGNRIAAVIVPLNKTALEKEDIISHCATRLPKYMIPEIVEFSSKLPMTSSGKVDRQKLSVLLSRHSTPG